MNAGDHVLLTGATGFVGRQVLPLLVARGLTVHAVGRTPPEGVPSGVEWHGTDLLAPGAARSLAHRVRATALLHLAWTVAPGSFWTGQENLDWLGASVDLYRGFVEAGGRRAAFVGTAAEYDWSHEWLDEQTTPRAPSTLYGTVKDSLHRVLRKAAEQDGVSLAWTRLFWMYGPFEATSRLVPAIILPLLREEPALCGDGLAQRDFMHVEDVAAALVDVLASGVEGGVNIASGECVPLRDIIMTIATGIGRPDLVRFGARPSPAGEPRRLQPATAVLRETVGFSPRHDLQSGLAATVSWWRDMLQAEQDKHHANCRLSLPAEDVASGTDQVSIPILSDRK